MQTPIFPGATELSTFNQRIELKF